MIDDLVPWLREQLDTDEAQVVSGDCRCPDPGLSRADCAARVLAEVDAKRRILSRCESVLRAFDHPESGMWSDVSRRERAHARETLRLLALPYADRPGYRDEWRPQPSGLG